MTGSSSEFLARLVHDATLLHQEGRLHEAGRLYAEVLDADPKNAEAAYGAGIIAFQQRQPGLALTLLDRAVALKPTMADYWYGRGLVQHTTGNLIAAEADFEKALQLQEAHAQAMMQLGQIKLKQNATTEAVSRFGAAVALLPRSAEANAYLGIALLKAGNPHDAASYLRQAAEIDPYFFEAYYNLGIALEQQNMTAEAESAWRRAIEINPRYLPSFNRLALSLQQREAHLEAQQVYENAAPFTNNGMRGAAEFWNNYGNLLHTLKQPEKAISAYEKAAVHAPHDSQLLTNLGTALLVQGRLAEAQAALRRAIDADSRNISAYSSLIYSLDFDPDADVETQQRERRNWVSRYASGLVIAPHRNIPDPERKLRIGYGPGDFFQHSATYSHRPIMLNHDRSRFDFFLYAMDEQEDAVTAELRKECTRWTHVGHLSADEAAAQIRADKIDILVDLSGFSAAQRLLIFARKPAPVQITAWGNVTGTGLSAMDYLFGDPIYIPNPLRHHFTETIVDLPCVIDYQAPSYAPDVAPLPALGERFFTFGCLNRLVKITDSVLALWARILNACPQSRLLLKDSLLAFPEDRTRIVGKLNHLGVNESRLVLLPETSHFEHLATYSEIDLALDTFPQNGGITTTEALWMGVPTVALLGQTPQSRIAASILHAAGLSDWVAQNEDQYVNIALSWARDVSRLAQLRLSLRAQFAHSPVGDVVSYTRAVEDSYRSLWRRWCLSTGTTAQTT